MGTRGIYGIRKDGTDKLTYNHYDSYPEGLGKAVVNFIISTPNDQIKKIFDQIELVNESDKPTAEQIKNCAPYTDLHVSNQSINDWYCLLRGAQGDLGVYKDGLRYMIDNHDFIKDSLFCEWGYIINLDNQTLEVYEGFQTEPNHNRYACEPDSDSKYFNCKLIAEFPLDNIPEDWQKVIFPEGAE